MLIKNRFLLLTLILALSLTLVIGCSDDDDPTDPVGDDDPNPGLENVGSISGLVTSGNGAPLSGATISTSTKSTTTNEDGYFVLTAVPEGSTLVSFTFPNYMSTFRIAQVTSVAATHYPDIALLVSGSGEIDSAAGGLVIAPGNDGNADFDADSFVNGAGEPYSGDVTVMINAMNTDNADFYGAFPGEFAGIREDGSEVFLVSYGIMAIELLGADKSPLMMADGVTAELNLTISADKAATAPATIPMWYFDESDGQWYEEGEAVLAGNTYTAEVAHFTTWNWDVPISDICSVTGFVVDDLGRPVADARVLSQGIDAAIMAETFTATDGSFTVNALKNSITDVWATSGSRASEAARLSVLEECPVVLADPLVLEVPAYTISLTWGEVPDDLDTHWFIPATWMADYDWFRICYYNEGIMGSDPYASVDTDDTSSFGPEIVSGTRFYNGSHQYWVHNYSNDTSAELQTSGASVQLEVAGAIWQFDVADVALDGADQTGWWHVFDMVVSAEGTNVAVESVMEFQPEFNSGNIYAGGDNAATRVLKK